MVFSVFSRRRRYAGGKLWEVFMPGEEHDRIAAEINHNTIELRIKGWVDNFKANLPKIIDGYGIASLVSTLITSLL